MDYLLTLDMSIQLHLQPDYIEKDEIYNKPYCI